MSWLRNQMLTCARPIHARLRQQKLNLFFNVVGQASKTTLLDVGGGIGIAGEFTVLYSFFVGVVVANIKSTKLNYSQDAAVQSVVADGCHLPFSSKAFDWVFSNAVIEHVGNWEKQAVFASEIRRVAKQGYFVTTPNKYFPIEPHTMLPFYQFLPSVLQRRILRFPIGYLTQYEPIYLLSARQLRKLFPEAQIIKSGLPVFANSLVAVHKFIR